MDVANYAMLLVAFVVDLDAERLEKFKILIADLELGIGAEGRYQGSLVGGVFALLADADGGFENEENVVAAFLDTGNDFGDRFGVGQRLVDRFSEFFHELFQLLIHESPWNRTPLTAASRVIAMPPVVIVRPATAKID
jgi:hypothetical protein